MANWFLQVWLTSLALARAWRWRGFAIASIAASGWLARQGNFPAGSLSWFPLGSIGVVWLTCFLAIGAAVLGVDCIGQWDRHRARALLETRLVRPLAFIIGQWFAVVLLCLFPAAVVSWWSPIGAWRGGFAVAWMPTLVFFSTTAMAAVAVGAAAGLLARALIPSDVPALVASLALISPFLWFRLFVAPADEFFLLTSESLGLLIPADLVAAEALAGYAFALPMMAGAAFLLPRPRAAGIARPHGLLRVIGLPGIRSLACRAIMRLRQHSAPSLVVLALLLVGGFPLGSIVANHWSERPRAVDWGNLREPDGTRFGGIDAPDVLHRRILLPDEPTGEIIVAMTLRAREAQDLLALTFGPYLEFQQSRVAGAPAERLRGALSPGVPAVVLRLPREVAAGEEFVIESTLRPTRSGERLWRRAWQPRFHWFSFLGLWHGETISVNYPFQEAGITFQRAPLEISAPRITDMAWSLGAASVAEAGNRVILSASAAERPERLVAGNLVELDIGGRHGFPLLARVLPNHSTLVASFPVMFSEELRRLGLLFTGERPALVLQEVPDTAPADPLAMSSAALDRLVILFPNFDHFREPTRDQFRNFFSRIHEGLVAETIEHLFSGFEEPALLRDGLAQYIHEIGLQKGLTWNLRRNIRREVVLVPWVFARRGVPPFLVAPGDVARWEGPISAVGRGPDLPPADTRRNLVFHHMLRGLMGEDAFTEFLRDLLSLPDRPVLTIDLYRQTAEKYHGEDLGWFFDQWLMEGVMPRLHIVEGQAFLLEDPATRALVYRIQVTVENRGTGRVLVPWTLAIEGESIEGTVWLGPGEQQNLELRSITRPVAFELDPLGWIAQPRPEQEPGSRRPPRRPQLFFRTITEL